MGEPRNSTTLYGAEKKTVRFSKVSFKIRPRALCIILWFFPVDYIENVKSSNYSVRLRSHNTHSLAFQRKTETRKNC